DLSCRWRARRWLPPVILPWRTIAGGSEMVWREPRPSGVQHLLFQGEAAEDDQSEPEHEGSPQGQHQLPWRPARGVAEKLNLGSFGNLGANAEVAGDGNDDQNEAAHDSDD